MIHRNVEKALYLLCVQIHCQNTVGPGGHQQIGYEFGRDRDSGLILPILPGIAVIRQYRGDAVSAGPLECIHYYEQLHQMMVCRRAGRLDDEHIFTADVLLDFGESLAVGKGGDGELSQVDADVATYGIGKR